MISLRAKIAILIVAAIVSVVALASLVAVAVIGRPGPGRMLDRAAAQIRLVSRMAEANPGQFSGNLAGTGLRVSDKPLSGEISEQLTAVMRDAVARLGESRALIVTLPHRPGPRPREAGQPAAGTDEGPDAGDPGRGPPDWPEDLRGPPPGGPPPGFFSFLWPGHRPPPPPMDSSGLGPPPGPPPRGAPPPGGPPRRGPPSVSVPLKNGSWIIMAMPDLPPPLVGWGILLGWMALIVAGATAIALYLTRRLTAPLALLQNTVVAMAPNGNLPELPESGPPEVRATAHAINSLSARLRSAVESRMRLVAAAGHDLRTPMTRMRLRAEFLPEEDRALWLKDLGELERIADSAIRLVREEARQEAAEIVALDLLLRDLVDDLAALGLNAELREAEPMSVHGGELGLTRALRNLAINAATHGRRAEISLARIDGWAEIRIEDQGPGIPEELLERVFEPFFRVDPARRQTVPGAGLGLAIAHEIITRNDGTLKLSNKPEGGLLQVVRLRLLAASEDRAPLREPQ